MGRLKFWQYDSYVEAMKAKMGEASDDDKPRDLQKPRWGRSREQREGVTDATQG